jgi:hypothetical protein
METTAFVALNITSIFATHGVFLQADGIQGFSLANTRLGFNLGT